MGVEERELTEKIVRVRVDTVKSFCECVGLLPPSSPLERTRRLGESIELIVRSIQMMCCR